MLCFQLVKPIVLSTYVPLFAEYAGMRFVQFRMLSDALKSVRVGLQKEDGVLDLSAYLPAGCNSLVNALNTFGGLGLIDKAKLWYVSYWDLGQCAQQLYYTYKLLYKYILVGKYCNFQFEK